MKNKKENPKLVKIDELLKKINNNILKGKKWKYIFDNKGANCYCICIIQDEKELHVGKFGTFDNVISALELIISMFNKELNDREGNNEKK